MKRFLQTCLLLTFTATAWAQKVYNNPTFGFSNAIGVTIKKVECTDKNIIMHFHAQRQEDNMGINAATKTVLQTADGSVKLYLQRAEGISTDTFTIVPPSGLDYKLIFPKGPSDFTKFDFIEESATTSDGEEINGVMWRILDIDLNERRYLIPNSLKGNWFDAQTGDYTLSLFENTAVYKSNVWQYAMTQLDGGTGSITLHDSNTSVKLYVASDGAGTLRIGENKADLRPVVRHFTGKPTRSAEIYDGATFFKPDTAIYCGYIRNYSPRARMEMEMTYNDAFQNNNAFTSDRTLEIDIQPNGYFYVKIPLCIPSVAQVQLGQAIMLYLEPGKTLFHVIDPAKLSEGLFMGTSAQLVTDLYPFLNEPDTEEAELSDSFFQEESMEHYRTSVIDNQRRADARMDSLFYNGNIGAKAHQVLKTNEQLNSLAMLFMHYDYQMTNSMLRQMGFAAPTEETDDEETPADTAARDSLAKANANPHQYFGNIVANIDFNNPLLLTSWSYLYFLYFYENSSKGFHISQNQTDAQDYSDVLLAMHIDARDMKAYLQDKHAQDSLMKNSKDVQALITIFSDEKWVKITRKNSSILEDLSDKEKKDYSKFFGALLKKGHLNDDERQLLKDACNLYKSKDMKTLAEFEKRWGNYIESLDQPVQVLLTLLGKKAAIEDSFPRYFDTGHNFTTEMLYAQILYENMHLCRELTTDQMNIFIDKTVAPSFLADYLKTHFRWCKTQADNNTPFYPETDKIEDEDPIEHNI